MSDNGGVSRSFKAGLRGFKARVFEGGVRSPLFVRWPGRVPAGATIDAQTSHIDLLPTFCELAGVPLPQDRPIDGCSLLPLLERGAGEATQHYVYHTWDRHFPNPDERWAISDGRWKLLRQGGKVALFDLEEDPGETRNVAERHPDRVRELRAEFVRWFEEVTDGQDYRPIRIPVGDPREPRVEIQPSWATLEGETVKYVFRAYDWDTIEGWRRPGESAAWQLDVQRAGRYEVAISYGCAGPHAGGVLGLTAGRSGADDALTSLDFTPERTSTANVFITRSLGVLDLQQGPAELKAKVLQSHGGELMRLNAIWLTRQEE
jgi:arylsulfatase A